MYFLRTNFKKGDISCYFKLSVSNRSCVNQKYKTLQLLFPQTDGHNISSLLSRFALKFDNKCFSVAVRTYEQTMLLSHYATIKATVNCVSLEKISPRYH